MPSSTQAAASIAAAQPTRIFRIHADGRAVGICVASSQLAAERAAKRASTRNTASKDDGPCDFARISATPLLA